MLFNITLFYCVTKHKLLDVDPTSIIESLDISSSTTNRPEFSSEEFEDFMALLTKWNLSEVCGSDILKFSRKICRDDVRLPTSVKQSYQLINQMNVPHISFKKLPIMTYMEETYYLHHRQIFDAIKKLLSNKEIFDNCTFDFKTLYSQLSLSAPSWDHSENFEKMCI